MLEVSERPVNATFRRYRLALRPRTATSSPRSWPSAVPWPRRCRPGRGDLVRTRPRPVLPVHRTLGRRVGHPLRGGQGWQQDSKDTGQVVQQWEHGYGRHPYFFALGFMPAGGGTARSAGRSPRPSAGWWSSAATCGRSTPSRSRGTRCPRWTWRCPRAAQPIRGARRQPQDHRAVPARARCTTGCPGDKRDAVAVPQLLRLPARSMIAWSPSDRQALYPPHGGNLGGMEASGFAINQVLAEARLRFDPLAAVPSSASWTRSPASSGT